MRNLTVFALFTLFFSGCAAKERASEPHIVYQDVYVPVKCAAQMPKKPVDDGEFETHKAKMIYYQTCEDLLKQCIGIKE